MKALVKGTGCIVCPRIQWSDRNSEDSHANLAQANDLTGDSVLSIVEVKRSTPGHGIVFKTYVLSPTNYQPVVIGFLLHSVHHDWFIKYTLDHSRSHRRAQNLNIDLSWNGRECNQRKGLRAHILSFGADG